ncbi:hypothetical protein F4777DRAFT_446138 [Nemania sp. FL0916]|nr:hypothetical protein F4777DRAFT_446138 [Nemania sp. FL0916]
MPDWNNQDQEGWGTQGRPVMMLPPPPPKIPAEMAITVPGWDNFMDPFGRCAQLILILVDPCIPYVAPPACVIRLRGQNKCIGPFGTLMDHTPYSWLSWKIQMNPFAHFELLHGQSSPLGADKLSPYSALAHDDSQNAVRIEDLRMSRNYAGWRLAGHIKTGWRIYAPHTMPRKWVALGEDGQTLISVVNQADAAVWDFVVQGHTVVPGPVAVPEQRCLNPAVLTAKPARKLLPQLRAKAPVNNYGMGTGK